MHSFEDGVKLPVALEEEKVTFPVGEEPVTVAVHVVDDPAATGEGKQETEVAAAGWYAAANV